MHQNLKLNLKISTNRKLSNGLPNSDVHPIRFGLKVIPFRNPDRILFTVLVGVSYTTASFQIYTAFLSLIFKGENSHENNHCGLQ